MGFPLCWLLLTTVGASWVELRGRPTVLQSDLEISYQIDGLDPARFHDIHCLLYSGSALLYAVRAGGPAGHLRIPCGVITHAGPHSLALQHTNGSVIATQEFRTRWPRVALAVPVSLETLTAEVTVTVSFTSAVCSPVGGADPQLLRGGERGARPVWLRVERCTAQDCTSATTLKIMRVDRFWRGPSSKHSIPCSDWDQAGSYRAVLAVEPEPSLQLGPPDIVIAASRQWGVEVSGQYWLGVGPGSLAACRDRQAAALVVELDYPACIPARDKVRLYRAAGNGPGHGTYLGEQRVVPGDHAVVFPCNLLYNSSALDRHCFRYIATAAGGAVSTAAAECLPTPAGSWASWSAWSACSVSCGLGSRSRYRFCSSRSCPGSRLQTEDCKVAACPPRSTSDPVSALSPAPARPTPEYGASPCECGCTYILAHSTAATRDLSIVSGSCPLPLTWTLRVSPDRTLLLNLTRLSLSCPELRLLVRNGVAASAPLLASLQAGSGAGPVVHTSGHTARLELSAADPAINTTACWLALGLTVDSLGSTFALSLSAMPA